MSEIEFRSLAEFPRGTLKSQLIDAYSFDTKWQELFETDWQAYDDFFYENDRITKDPKAEKIQSAEGGYGSGDQQRGDLLL